MSEEIDDGTDSLFPNEYVLFTRRGEEMAPVTATVSDSGSLHTLGNHVEEWMRRRGAKGDIRKAYFNRRGQRHMRITFQSSSLE